jgi:hypothetical protein
MKFHLKGTLCGGRSVMALVLLVAPAALYAQTDEIQVYDAEIADQGVFNVMLHTNYTPIGRKVGDFSGSIIPNQSVNGAVEWAYGVKDWFEQGLYAPVWSPYSQDRGGSINGFKIRELFVRPHAADRKFFYGVNFEFSVNYLYWEPRHITSEIRPIVGLHLKPVDIIINPIVDTQYRGGTAGLEFVPAERVAYNINDKWTVALEEYSDYGTFHNILSAHDQFHEVWAVFDHPSKFVDIEAGVGLGVTSGADRLTFKLMVSRDLNAKPKDAAAIVGARPYRP